MSLKYYVNNVKNSKMDSDFQSASEYGRLNDVKYFIEKCNVDVHADSDYAVRMAAKYGHLDVVKYLVEKCNADVHTINEYAACKAVENCHFDIVNYFIEECDTDVHTNDDYIFQQASINRCLDDVGKYKVDVHVDSDFAIRWAASEGHLNVVKYLVELELTYTQIMIMLCGGL